MSDIPVVAPLDVRTLPPRDRHPAIFRTFAGLAVQDAMELVNDHDLGPLLLQFEVQAPGQFSWQALERGPLVWAVRITRVSAPRAAAHAQGSCCGSCGGQ